VGLPALRAQFQLPNFNFGGGSEGEASKAGGGGNVALKQKLLEICGDSRQGIEGTGSVSQEEFDGLVEQLIANNPTQNPAESSLMTGRWKMAWTTEKEILFCVEKGLFGLPCTDVYQTIDSSAGTLKNVIEFTDQGFLKVDSNFKDQQGARFNFKFQSCALKWMFLEVPLPPVGEGWGEQVYLDDTLRIQRDSRGDTLIAVRV